jgi:hypothetical protein
MHSCVRSHWDPRIVKRDWVQRTACLDGDHGDLSEFHRDVADHMFRALTLHSLRSLRCARNHAHRARGCSGARPMACGLCTPAYAVRRRGRRLWRALTLISFSRPALDRSGPASPTGSRARAPAPAQARAQPQARAQARARTMRGLASIPTHLTRRTAVSVQIGVG